MRFPRPVLTLIAFAMLPFSLSGAALAQYGPATGMQQSAGEEPAGLSEFQNLQQKKQPMEGEDTLPMDIRLDAQREAAFSLGARGGLAWRTWHIRNELETRGRYMDQVFDFRELLIPAPNGLLIEPPIVSEGLDALLIANRGEQAAVADKVLRINRNARIVSTARDWRAYLERNWGAVEPPPDVLLPRTPDEVEEWYKNVEEGWNRGIQQADDIFQSDLNRLVADYQGMVRYKSLIAQNMISPPYALATDRGVTGGGDEMRIGDRALEITDPAALKATPDQWQPANR